MIRRISGKSTPAAISHLKINNTTIEQPTEIANIIASTIAHNSSSDHYTDSFQWLKSWQEKQEIKFSSDNSESYNLPFSKAELTSAIRKAHDSATGPDSIYYQMLKNLLEIALNTLLRVFNDLWVTGNLPSSCSEATVIPIPKPEKDLTDLGTTGLLLWLAVFVKRSNDSWIVDLCGF